MDTRGNLCSHYMEVLFVTGPALRLQEVTPLPDQNASPIYLPNNDPGGPMKSLLVAIALTLPTMSSAAEYMHVECYMAEGTETTKTFEGHVFGTVKNSGNRVLVEGKNIADTWVHRRGTPATCEAPTRWNNDHDGYGYESNNSNVWVFEFDYALIELNCAAGSVVKRYGDIVNFTKAIEARVKRNAPVGGLPKCLDLTGIQ